MKNVIVALVALFSVGSFAAETATTTTAPAPSTMDSAKAGVANTTESAKMESKEKVAGAKMKGHKAKKSAKKPLTTLQTTLPLQRSNLRSGTHSESIRRPGSTP